MEELSNINIIKKRVRDDSDESDFDSPEVKRLRDDLLDSLDDSDLGSTSPDLDSFMKSFEEEITASNPPPPTAAAAIMVDLTSDSGESQPELGYLLEASDDELGLPPSTTPSSEVDNNNNNNKGTEFVRVSSESWFDDQIPSYDSYEFGIGNGNNNGEYAPFDSLFDNSDLGDFPDIWFPATLPAQ